MTLIPSDVIFARNVEGLERQERILGKMARFISPGFCKMCGHDDGMQPLDWRGVRQLDEELIFTDKGGQMYTPCFHCNTGQIVPDDYRQADPHEAMAWAIADRKAEFDAIGDNAAEREDWRRRYERGAV